MKAVLQLAQHKERMMIISIGLTVLLVAASIFIHYEFLRVLSLAMPRLTIPLRSRLLLVIGVVFVAHLLEIGLFAVAFEWMQSVGLGEISGQVEGGWAEMFYFSAASYTTLGMGDLVPSAELRFITAIESLAGLVLIGWSTSFTYLSMREFWDLHPRDDR